MRVSGFVCHHGRGENICQRMDDPFLWLGRLVDDGDLGKTSSAAVVPSQNLIVCRPCSP